MSKFIYVFKKNDRDALLASNLKLIKSDDANNTYVFENPGTLTFELADMSVIFSDTLTF